MGLMIAEHPLGSNGLGGKAAGLETLNAFHRKGVFNRILGEMKEFSRFRDALNVLVPEKTPSSMVLTDGCFFSYLSQERVRDAMLGGDYAKISDAMDSCPIRDAITLEAIRKALSECGLAMAVRSSASCEDRTKYLFSGSFSTMFVSNSPSISMDARVSMAEFAVRQVYKSMFEPKVVAKMRRYGLAPEEHSMSVILQSVVGNSVNASTASGPLQLFFPEIGALIASKSPGLRAFMPEGVSRKSPATRFCFGLGTFVVARDKPCSLVFMDKPVISLPATGAHSDGRSTRDPELRHYMEGYQDSFDAIDLATGGVKRLSFAEITNQDFFTPHRGIFSGLNDELMIVDPGSMNFSFDPRGDSTIRATFSKFVNGPFGTLMVEFFGRVAKELRERCGYDVDLEAAVAQIDGGKKLAVSFVQLRQFGMAGDPVQLSEVPRERKIAETSDGMGHGSCEADYVLLVTKEAAYCQKDLEHAQAAVSSVDSKHPGKYIIVGPNITREMGWGGVYAQLFSPGAIVSFSDDSISLTQPFSHDFNELAKVLGIETDQESAQLAEKSIMSFGPGKLSNGVYLLKKQAVVEMEGESGIGQAFWR